VYEANLGGEELAVEVLILILLMCFVLILAGWYGVEMLYLQF
jgi:hypothetical protein